MLKAILAFFVLAVVMCPVSGHCAFVSSSSGKVVDRSAEQTLPDDIVLPMPQDQKMILRPVAVPAGAIIRDKTFAMGVNNPEDKERQIFERQFMGHISAPFTTADFPKEWVSRLQVSAGKGKGDSWYFIGKYEVTVGQWRSVMETLTADGEEIPSSSFQEQADDNMPVTNVSWFEVQEFLHRYNLWLIRNHKDNLPVFRGTKNIGFLRLPTEEEWEYAARGGGNVPAEWWADQDFYPLEGEDGIAGYAVYQKPRVLSKPAAGGSRKPNPLGLYDTSGNVKEMVQGFFHMSIPDIQEERIERRLHGSAGGIIVKGGSFRSEEQAVLPGAREEIPLYAADGAVGSSDLGFRVVLAGINFPSGERLAELKKEDAKPVAPAQKAAPGLGENMSASEMVAALIAASSGDMKSDLEKLQARVDDQARVEKDRQLKNLESIYRSLLYQSETLRAFAFRYSAAAQNIAKIRGLLKENLDKSSREKAEGLLKVGQDNLKDYLQSLEMGARYYKINLGDIYANSRDELSRLAGLFKREYSGSGIFNEHMRQNIEILEKNLATVRSRGLKALSPGDILKGIIPQEHYNMLPKNVRI